MRLESQNVRFLRFLGETGLPGRVELTEPNIWTETKRRNAGQGSAAETEAVSALLVF